MMESISGQILDLNLNDNLSYTAQQIQGLLGAQAPQLPYPNQKVAFLCIDSRHIPFPEATLFCALSGRQTDGHHFIPDVAKSEVKTVLVQRLEPEFQQFPSLNILLVADVVAALQQLARHHRSQFQIPIIGITGSNGKTIVKDWLSQLCHLHFSVLASPRSFNSQIGVPLSVWQLQNHHTLGIFEAGISQMDEMSNLKAIIQPTIGIFTNIGSAHEKGFPDLETKVRQKLTLFKDCQKIIFCQDHSPVAHQISQTLPPEVERVNWSENDPTAKFFISEKKTSSEGTQLTGRWMGENYLLNLPFSDAVSIENAIQCWVTCMILHIPMTSIQTEVLELHALPMRLSMKQGKWDSILIDDSYTFDLSSLRKGLHFLNQQSGPKETVLILSDMDQRKQPLDVWLTETAAMVSSAQVNLLIGIGREIPQIAAFLPAKVQTLFFPSVQELARRISPLLFQEKAILIKGARKFKLERISHQLSLQTHRTHLEIDLHALDHNVAAFATLLNARTKIMAVIKASAYGSGSTIIARHLAHRNIDYFVVAYGDEALALREAGIKQHILVLNPEETALPALLEQHIELEIYSQALLQQLITYTTAQQLPCSVHIKLDTGMHRLGFEVADLPELVSNLAEHQHIKVKAIFTHLASSDVTDHDAFSKTQVALFNEMYKTITTTLGYKPARHILNSAGILRFPEFQFDMVRLGLGLYGINPLKESTIHLEPVFTFKTIISQIREVAAGESVGYNRKGWANKPLTIATLSVGYADGFPRIAGNGRFWVFIQGEKAPIIGNICMDMCMVDITGIPGVEEGMEVEIFGKNHPIMALSDAAQTIPYEILTGISDRVPRTYKRD